MKMTKTTITIFAACLLGINALKAQTIQEGINHLYAEREKSAKATFDKLIAANPNNLDAIYWLGQTYFAMNNPTAARELYSKTLSLNGNAPLIMVGMAHYLLTIGKKDEAHQLFETAITLSTGKKGPDPNILNAIGRANIDAKDGDAAYAIDKLKTAAEKDPKNADIFLNLGDAYRKVHEGGQAVVNYDKAIQASPTLARAAFRKAMIYYTQQNWDLFEELLNQSITMDPKFAPAYYQLYYIYLLNRKKQDFSIAQDYANKYVANSDKDPQNEYLVAQTCWAKAMKESSNDQASEANKDYDCSINTAKGIIAKAGEQTKAIVYRLLAYAYVGKNDTLSAKQYVDQFFSKAKEEDINPADYILRGQIYGTTSGDDNVVLESYVKAAQLDSVYSSKMETIQKGVDYFEKKKKWLSAAEMRIVQSKTRKTNFPTDPFFVGLRFYQGGNYQRADSSLRAYVALAPDTVFGHYYRAKINFALDTSMMVEPFASTMVQEYQKTLDLALNDKVKFKSQAIEASKLLAGYFNNIKKNKDSAILYLQKGQEFDPTNTSLQELIDYLKKVPTKPTKGKPTGSTKPSASIVKPTVFTAYKKSLVKS